MNPSPDQWRRVKELFATALPLAAASRRTYLVDACAGNDALRAQVEALLLAHEKAAPSFLAVPAQLAEAMSTSRIREGTRLGPYEFGERIGAGGMGEVYKGRDTRLERTVAIKVLPAHIATDPLARDRFEREARAVAALNHQHICTLHDIGSQDGIDFLVMEYLVGETLAARLERGPLPLADALQYASQIASALDKVHRAGIVHRDLKPGNVMLTKAGAKLLDFGLSNALATEIAPGVHAPQSSRLTSAGMILGTVQYMAPEQLEGRRADARSDIFAFGAVLYEMVSGRKAFNGADHSGLTAAIRQQEPEPLSNVPPLIDRIIRTCLAKDPDDRWQTARDLLRELQWSGDPAAAGVPSSARSARKARVAAWTAAIVAAVATTAAASIAYLYLQRPDMTPPPARFQISTPATNDPLSFALSPDGGQLAFVAADNGVPKLWLRPLNQLAPAALAGTEGASYPFWAPDGSAIGFFADGKLKRLDLDGGPPRVLADAPTTRGGTWSADGVIVFAPSTAGSLMRVPATGGQPTSATQLADGENTHRWPQFLPDGKRFLYLSTLGRSGTQGIFVASLGGGAPKRVLEDDAPASFAPPDMLLLVREGTLVAFRLKTETAEVIGEPMPVAQPIGFDAVIVKGAFTVSQTGILAYRPAIAGPRQLVWTDRTGATHATIGGSDDNALAAPELTRDGLRLATFRTVDGNADVWLTQVVGGAASRFTSHPRPDIFPLWFPDGRRLVFTASRDGTFDLYERAIDSEGDDQLLLHSQYVKAPVDFLPDGRLLLFAMQAPKTGVDLWGMRLDGDRTPFPVVQTPFNEMAGQFSPDGQLLAYESNSSGRLDVYVRPFPGEGRSWRVSPQGGSQARWSRDGKELFYVAFDGRLMSVAIRLDAAGRLLAPALPVPLFPTRLASGANIPPAVGSKQQYDVAPDGRFLMNVSVEGGAAPSITIVLNWPSALTSSRR